MSQNAMRQPTQDLPRRGRGWLRTFFVGVLLFVSALHGFWDGAPSTVFFVAPLGIPVSVVTLVLGIVGVVILFIVYRGSVSRQMQEIATTNNPPQERPIH